MLPDSIPSSVWDEFRKHRRKLKAPMTDHAETLILCKLEKWRLENGANPIDVLNESMERGWKGVFLNGHAAPVVSLSTASQDIRQSASGRLAPAEPVCCMCGKPCLSGFTYTSRGRRCHAC